MHSLAPARSILLWTQGAGGCSARPVRGLAATGLPGLVSTTPCSDDPALCLVSSKPQESEKWDQYRRREIRLEDLPNLLTISSMGAQIQSTALNVLFLQSKGTWKERSREGHWEGKVT